MKYQFQRFKIQLVNKKVVNLIRNQSNKQQINIHKKSLKKARQTKTAEIHKKRYQHIIKYQNDFKLENDELVSYNSSTINRVNSFKQQKSNNYKEWLKLLKLHSPENNKQYQIFQEKCIDLLCKKKNNSNISRVSKISSVNNNSMNHISFLNKNSLNNTIQKTTTVHQMMSNIINKFKSESKFKYFKDKLQNQEIKNQVPFMTKKNLLNPQKQKRIVYSDCKKNNKLQRQSSIKEEKSLIFQSKNSTELKQSISQDNKNSFLDMKFIPINQEQNNKSNPRYSEIWRDIPDITGVRMNKRLLKNENSVGLNFIVCQSISLNQSNQLKKNLLFGYKDKNQSSPSKISQQSINNKSKRKIIHLNKPYSKIKFMKFNKNSTDQQYNKKIKAYLDFLFKINFSNNIYINLQLCSIQDTINYHKYKVYIGQGNNCNLIKSLLKRREWIQIVQNINEEGIQFYWTQNKIKNIHQKQEKSINFKKQQVNVNHDRKRSTINIQDTIQLNNKIYNNNKRSENVQEYIFKDGFQIPFQKEYITNIVTNHIPDNHVIGSKKNLFKSMFSYYNNIIKKDPFSVIPKTYHIKCVQDPQFKRFINQNKKQPNKLWIVKPGQNTNRGNGIKLRQFIKIQSLVRQKIRHQNGHLQTYIIQSYINKPFLYNGRKFDIRHYLMITSVNGIVKAYWYRDGYIRTSSQMYDLQDYQNQFIHLTNDAIQIKGQCYGKYQQANKLSYSQFQRYLDYNFTNKGYNFQNVIKQMKNIITDVIKATYLNLDKNRKKDNFQLFGFDFMLDKDLNPYLIQINFNPCLVVNCNVLNRIIPPLIQNTFRIGLDPLLPPKNHLGVNKRNNLSENYLKNLRYQLIFDQSILDIDIVNKAELQDSSDQEQQYNDNGKQIGDNFVI